MRSSYQIREDLFRFLEEEMDECYDAETGEIKDTEAWARLDKLLLEREEKIKQLGLWLRDEKAFVEQMKEQRRDLSARIDAHEKKVENIKEYIRQQMSIFGDRKLEYPNIGVRIGTSRSVEITDYTAIPEKYIRTKTIVEPMKAEIKKAIENGEAVQGAKLIEKDNIQVR